MSSASGSSIINNSLNCPDIYKRSPHDDYTVEIEIGGGTYGKVYKAKRKRGPGYAAIKVIKLEPGDDFGVIQQEIVMMKQCTHPNIVRFYDSYLKGHKLYICMEYCGGGSMQDIYQVTGALSEPQIAFVLRETLKGLDYLHEKRTMHRDIKGANILLCEDGEVKLADFGVSAQMTATCKRKSFIGTPYWMAPEVAAVERKGGYNQQCDIWAVGICAIEFAELQPPMFDLHPMRVLFLMSKSSFKPPTLKDKGRWSQNLHSFVKVTLTKNPKKRPTAERLLDEHPFLMGDLTKRLSQELLFKFKKTYDQLRQIEQAKNAPRRIASDRQQAHKAAIAAAGNAAAGDVASYQFRPRSELVNQVNPLLISRANEQDLHSDVIRDEDILQGLREQDEFAQFLTLKPSDHEGFSELAQDNQVTPDFAPRSDVPRYAKAEDLTPDISEDEEPPDADRSDTLVPGTGIESNLSISADSGLAASDGSASNFSQSHPSPTVAVSKPKPGAENQASSEGRTLYDNVMAAVTSQPACANASAVSDRASQWYFSPSGSERNNNRQQARHEQKDNGSIEPSPVSHNHASSQFYADLHAAVYGDSRVPSVSGRSQQPVGVSARFNAVHGKSHSVDYGLEDNRNRPSQTPHEPAIPRQTSCYDNVKLTRDDTHLNSGVSKRESQPKRPLSSAHYYERIDLRPGVGSSYAANGNIVHVSDQSSHSHMPEHKVFADQRNANSVETPTSPSDGSHVTPLQAPPRRRRPDPRRELQPKPAPDIHGLPPTPKVHMGACFSKIFNGCPLHINCTASWVHPEKRDQIVFFGADEGIYTLNLTELHEGELELVHARPCRWLYVINNVMMSLSGKNMQLFRHDLAMLCNHKTGSRLSLQKKVPEKFLPRYSSFSSDYMCMKLQASVKVPDTKGCIKCCVGRNSFNGYRFLCAALNNRIMLLQWYEPLNKFMLLKHVDCSLPSPLDVFEILIVPGQENPKAFVGATPGPKNSLELHLVDLNQSTNWYDTNAAPDSQSLLPIVCVRQLERDSFIVGTPDQVRIVNIEGKLRTSKRFLSQLHFDFPVEFMVVLKDSILAFHKHGMQGRSFRDDSVTQEINDQTRIFRVLGSDRVIVLESRPTDDPEADVNLYVLAGHEASGC